MSVRSTKGDPAMPGQPPPLEDEGAQLLAYIAQQRDGLRYAAYGLTDEQARLTPDGGHAQRRRAGQACHGHGAELDRHGAPAPAGALRRRAGVELRRRLPARARRHPGRRPGPLRRGGEGDRSGGAPASPTSTSPSPCPRACPGFPQDLDAWSVRWVLLHLVEETARHAGHADIVRESIDGATMYALDGRRRGLARDRVDQALEPPGLTRPVTHPNETVPTRARRAPGRRARRRGRAAERRRGR